MPIKCSECGELLKAGPGVEVPRKCPKCGSSKHTHILEIADTMTLFETLRTLFYVIKVKFRLV
jgi:predicted  nucleic acid-binding Zn-ribbon protein